MTSGDIAAWASAAAAFASLAVAVVVAKMLRRWDDERLERENRKVIRTFIEELNEACASVYARVVFWNLDVPESDVAFHLEEAASIPERYVKAFSRAESELARFDDASAPVMIDAVRGVNDFMDTCRRLAREVRDGAIPDRVDAIRRMFLHQRGRMDALMSSVGPHLVRYGATPAAWHGLPDSYPD